MQKKIAVIATGLVLTLGITACSSKSSNLDSVEYNLNGATAAASASFETPFRVNGTQSHVIEEGSGADIEDGDHVVINATVFDGSNGEKLGDTYIASQPPISVVVDEKLKESDEDLYNVLSSGKVGMSFAYSSDKVTVADSSGSPSASPLPKDSSTNVEIYTVGSMIEKEPSGTENKDLNSPYLESFTLDADKNATITLKEDRGAAPDQVVTEDLITGDSQKVGENDYVYVKYQGVRYENGEAFDGNYSSDVPANFSLNQVIPGWKEALTGKTVGSRVFIVIPADQAYGDEPSNGPAGPLVFVVDILGAIAGPAPQSAAPTDSASAAPGETVSPEPSTSSSN